MTAIGERHMGLGALTDAVGPERVVGIPVGEVRGLAYDSRRAGPGTLFFAVPGDHVDGHDFVGEAANAGAIAAVVERELPDVGVPQLVVDRTRRALADAAFEWFGRPRDHLFHAIGVTGTDGKSTVTALAGRFGGGDLDRRRHRGAPFDVQQCRGRSGRELDGDVDGAGDRHPQGVQLGVPTPRGRGRFPGAIRRARSSGCRRR